MSIPLHKVLIVGGGVAGTAMAILLRKRGVPVDLIDIDPVWTGQGAGITITGPTLRALRPTAEPNGWMNPYWGAFRALELEVAADLLRAAGGRGAA